MAILTSDQERVFNAWSSEFPDEMAAFFAKLNAEYGPSSDADELLRRFQIKDPSIWLQLITSLNARYSATEADVERAVGRAALGRNEDQAVSSVSGDYSSCAEELRLTKESLERCKARRERDADAFRELMASGASASDIDAAIEEGARLERIEQSKRDWVETLTTELRRDWNQRHPSAPTSVQDARFVSGVIGPMTYGTTLYGTRQIPRIIDALEVARRLDATPNVFEPRTASIRLAINSALGV